jgi:hypothetical protein
MAERKDRMALLSRYNKLYLQKYEVKSVINLNAEQWAADALIESYGIGVCYDLLDYYFNVALAPSWSYFAYNAEKILQAKLDKIKDDEERSERRAMAKKWLND